MQEAMLAACLSMVVTMAVGHPMLTWLRAKKLGKAYTGDEPAEYESKAGTPIAGGLMFMTGIIVAGLAFGVSRNQDILIPLVAMVVAGGMGVYDDFQNLDGAQKLSGHETWFWLVKWAVQLGIGVVAALIFYYHLDLDSVLVPHFGAYSLGLLYLPVMVAVFVASTSGALITDGMDGLMAGVSALAYAAYGTIALSQGQDALGAFAFAVTGGAAAFLWFNANPAQIFMTEVGAQPLAVGLVLLAFMTGWWLLLPIIACIFFVEGLSDVIQIGYFKATKGKRFFRMAPVHYHFQLGGWTETQVVTRFWLVGLLGGLAGVALALAD